MTEAIATIPHGSDAWWEARATRIGASEIGAVLGIDKYRTPLKLFMEKHLGRKAGGEEDHRNWGSDMEPAILSNFARRQGYKLLPSRGLLVHPTLVHLCATPDGLVLREARIRDVQAKNVEEHHAREWGEPGTSDAPLLYVAQVTMEVGILLAHDAAVEEEGDLAVSIGGRPPLGYPIPFDRDLFGSLSDAAAKFVRDHLQTGKPPALEGDRAALDYVKRRFRASTGELLQPTAEAVALAKKLAAAKADACASEGTVEQLQAQLCALIGEAHGFEGLCTWGVVREQRKLITEWPLLVEALTARFKLDRTEVLRLLKEFTREVVVKESYRRLTLAKERNGK